MGYTNNIKCIIVSFVDQHTAWLKSILGNVVIFEFLLNWKTLWIVDKEFLTIENAEKN